MDAKQRQRAVNKRLQNELWVIEVPRLVLSYLYSSISLFDRPTLAQPLGLETKEMTDVSDPHGT